MIQQIRDMGVQNEEILSAIESTDRRDFTPDPYKDAAYADRAIPIGYGQTMSQPYTVARMCELLIEGRERWERKKVLEIGTGSGWQTCILARLFDRVYTVEIIGELAERAKDKIYDLRFTNVRLKTGDGKSGWGENAQYDGIICGANARDIPKVWREQLAEGGKIVCPVKGEMTRIYKIPNSKQFETEKFGGYVFVPLV